MPCKDTSELIKIVLDHNERLTDYSFQKFSCGKVVGEENLIGRWLFGRTAAAILAIKLDEFELEIDLEDDLQHYLALKHLVALQKGLAVLLGHNPGGLDDSCAVEYINHSPEGLEMVARLRPW
jgi:NifU-like protein involved in Fe-S cluster formation